MPKIRLPSVVVLVGPNGAGKSALLDALLACARVACLHPSSTQGQGLASLLPPFLSKKTVDRPTVFCLEIEDDWLAPGQDRQLFRYEFSLERDVAGSGRSRFRRETLSHFPKGRPRRLFDRRSPETPIYTSSEFRLKAQDARLQAVRPDTSVISTLAMLNVELAKRIADVFYDLSSLTNLLKYENYQIPTAEVAEMLEQSPGLRDWITERMQCSDLGIHDITVANNTRNKVVRFDHYGLDEPVELYRESSGTKRLFHLLPQLHALLDRGCPGVFDELESDLHIDMVREVVHWFQSQETNPNDAQLFMSSHNVGLLEDLEKEEVFVLEKSPDGATQVHGAQDVRGLRRDSRLYSKYRTGVLGGLPRIG